MTLPSLPPFGTIHARAGETLLRLLLPPARELSLLRALFRPERPLPPPESLRRWDLLSTDAPPPRLRGVHALLSLFPYEGEAGEAVRRAKYCGLPFPSRAAAERLREMLEGPWNEALPDSFSPAVVPVPMTPWTYLRRGFHLPSKVARRLSLATGHPFLPRLVVRTREGAPQASLPLSGREGNVKGLFRPGRRHPDAPPDVLLVDDVATSGATATACAAALKAGGARFIVVVTLAMAAAPGGNSGYKRHHAGRQA